VAGRDVQVVARGTDTFGRTLGGVRVDALDVNAELVRLGYAWVFRRYEQDATLLALEAEARATRRGLWRDADPVPPWVWRETHARPRNAPVASAHPPPSER
jgi:endonuclease YncB( thermonuclease family)